MVDTIGCVISRASMKEGMDILRSVIERIVAGLISLAEKSRNKKMDMVW